MCAPNQILRAQSLKSDSPNRKLRHRRRLHQREAGFRSFPTSNRSSSGVRECTTVSDYNELDSDQRRARRADDDVALLDAMFDAVDLQGPGVVSPVTPECLP